MRKIEKSSCEKNERDLDERNTRVLVGSNSKNILCVYNDKCIINL